MASKKVVPMCFLLIGHWCVAEAAQHYPVRKVNLVPEKKEVVIEKANIQYSGLRQKRPKRKDLFSFIRDICHEKNYYRGEGHDPRHKNHKATKPIIY